MLSIRASRARQSDTTVGANIPISWPSPVRLPAPFPFLRASGTTTLCRLSAAAPSFLLGVCVPGRSLFQPSIENKDRTSSGRVPVFFICLCLHMSAARCNIFPFTAPRSALAKCFFCNYFHKLFVCGGWNKQKSQWKCWPRAIPGFVSKNQNVRVSEFKGSEAKLRATMSY